MQPGDVTYIMSLVEKESLLAKRVEALEAKVAELSASHNNASTGKPQITAACKGCQFVENDWVAGVLVCPFEVCRR